MYCGIQRRGTIASFRFIVGLSTVVAADDLIACLAELFSSAFEE